ncbi:MAG: homocysteine S-methyltransferase family protein [Anaerolineales bacterium]|nr:homocysteine S-methyltransferase family protein [Anaerolineales bacterium]
MRTFRERLSDPRPILLDGAMGTELEHRGINTDTPIWSAMALIEKPDLVEQVHRDYLDAGAEVLITNTFRTHRRNLARVGMGERAAELTALAVAIAQKAVRASGQEAWVAGSMAPLEDSYTANALPYETYLSEHGEMAAQLAAAGADLLLVETISTIREAAAAATAALATGLPYGVSFICKKDGRMFSGELLAEAVAALQPFTPDFLGINCTAAPELHLALAELRNATNLPIAVYANPSHTEDYQHWDETAAVDPQVYAGYGERWLQGGAQLLGGCCGTTPEHIAALHDLIGVEDA